MPLIIAEIEKDDVEITKEEKKFLLIQAEYEPDTDLYNDLSIDVENDTILSEYIDPNPIQPNNGTNDTNSEEKRSMSQDGGNIPSKQDPKNKSSQSPENSPNDVTKNGNDPLKPNPKNIYPDSKSTQVESFIVHPSQKEAGKNYWAYRDHKNASNYLDYVYSNVDQLKSDFDSKKLGSPQDKSIVGYVPYFFNADFNTLAGSFKNKIKSPLDVALLMNFPECGIVNPIVPYIGKENTEQHQLIFLDQIGESAYGKYPDELVGLYTNQLSPKEGISPLWKDSPFWCGATAGFFIRKAGATPPKGITGTGELRKNYVREIINYPEPFGKNFVGGGFKGSLEKWKNQFDNNLGPWGPNGSDAPNVGIDLRAFTTRALTEQYRDRPVKPPRGDARWGHFEWFDTNGSAALFVNNVHFNNEGLTARGKELLKYVMSWPAAVIVKNTLTETGGHIELCLAAKPNGEILNIGGNTGGSTPASRNGADMTLKRLSISRFANNGDKKSLSDIVLMIKVQGANKWRSGGLDSSFYLSEIYTDYLNKSNNKKQNPNINDNFKKLLDAFGVSPK